MYCGSVPSRRHRSACASIAAMMVSGGSVFVALAKAFRAAPLPTLRMQAFQKRENSSSNVGLMERPLGL